MHPGSGRRGASYVEFALPKSPKLGSSVWLRASVAINDKNNWVGRAGSPLVFSVTSGDKLLWQSKGVQKTGDVQHAMVDVTGLGSIRLNTRATGSNACAHAVWIDPQLVTKAKAPKGE